MSSFDREHILSVHHWTEKLFSFTATRSPSLRFQNGQFAMIGIEVDGRPLLRAYSMASANWEDHLEFLSIKVPDGPLTSRLQHIQPGDTLLVGRKPTGTIILGNLLPGRTLWLLATGTGLAPFMSLIKDPEVYETFERVVLVHGCRQVAELAYRDWITEELPRHELLGELVRGKLAYYPTVTREPFTPRARITDLIQTGRINVDLGLPPLDPAADRLMLCGSPAMLADTSALLEARGFISGSASQPGHYVIEKAFVEK